MALLGHALVSLDEARRHLRKERDMTIAEWDTLERAINAVTVAAEREIGRQIVARALTERYNGNGKTHLFLNQYPVTAVSSIKAYHYDGSLYHTYDVGAGRIVVSATGRVDVLDQLPLLKGNDNIEVISSPGWTETPDDLRFAALQWATDLFRKWHTEREPIQHVSAGGQTTTFRDAAIPPEVLQALERYRLAGAA